MHRILADLSRALSRITGGNNGTTVCHRIAMRWGWRCWFCSFIDWLLSETGHCLDELSPQEIVDLAKRRK